MRESRSAVGEAILHGINLMWARLRPSLVERFLLSFRRVYKGNAPSPEEHQRSMLPFSSPSRLLRRRVPILAGECYPPPVLKKERLQILHHRPVDPTFAFCLTCCVS